MLGAVVESAKAAFQRRMVVTDDVGKVARWVRGLEGLQVGWDSLELPGFKFLRVSDSSKVLGKTYDNLVLDLRGSFSANDIARVVPTVRGGGLVVFITPRFEDWVVGKQKHHERLVTPPYTLEDCRHIFVPRMIRKFYEHEGIWVWRGGRWDKESLRVEPPPPRSLKLPDGELPREIYGLARTQDQIDVLKGLEGLTGKAVLTANRGRGKSAALGLFVAGFRALRGRKTEVVVVAPSREGVSTVFEFIERGLKVLGIPYGYKNGILLGKQIKVVFEEPVEALRRKADLFVVDEASGIPLPILKELAGKEPVVFSTTIHGYEGSGRTFTLRFLPFLGECRRLSMEEPVRYARGDPVEAWLFDTFLLDAEPDDPAGVGKLVAKVPDPKELFSDEALLRATFGLLVTAHYRNTPNDLQTLADAPHHFVQLTLSSGKVVGVVQFAYEGGAPPGEGEGNLIPDIFYRHYGLEDFSRLKGARIVRIVTHPKLWRRGIGSFSLSSLDLKLDWVGASFGASAPLVRFWARNGYVPVALSPHRNPVSGEYSVVFLKPRSREATGLCSKASREFSLRFIDSLGDVYWDMDPETALELLRCFHFSPELELGETSRKRLELFLAGKHVYELDADLIAKLARSYFLSGGDFLSRDEGLVLVSKVLQNATWKTVREKTGVEEVFETVRNAVVKIYENLF